MVWTHHFCETNYMEYEYRKMMKRRNLYNIKLPLNENPLLYKRDNMYKHTPVSKSKKKHHKLNIHS